MHTETNAMLATMREVSKSYGPVRALTGLDLQLQQGRVTALLGPNGAGKSTAFGILNGLIKADAGTVRLFDGSPRDDAARRRVGVMLQSADLPDTLTVREHLQLFSGYYANPRPIAETLALAGLEALAHRRYSALSGGQQRSVQFALALCGRPELLVLDEPTTGMDVDARIRFWALLREEVGRGLGILLCTHHLDEADAVAHDVVVLHQGRVIARGTPAELKAHIGGRRIRCRTALALEAVSSWDEVSAARREGEFLMFESSQSDISLRRLLAADQTVAEIEVQPLGLEQAFVALTRAENDSTHATEEAA